MPLSPTSSPGLLPTSELAAEMMPVTPLALQAFKALPQPKVTAPVLLFQFWLPTT